MLHSAVFAVAIAMSAPCHAQAERAKTSGSK